MSSTQATQAASSSPAEIKPPVVTACSKALSVFAVQAIDSHSIVNNTLSIHNFLQRASQL